MARLEETYAASQPRYSMARGPGSVLSGGGTHYLPLLILIYVCLIFAPEAAVVIAGLNVTAYRVAILIMVVPAILRFIRGETKLITPDIAIIIGSVWMAVSFLTQFEPVEAISRSLGIIVDALGAYLIARTSIRSHEDLLRVFILASPGFLFVGIVLALESVTHTIIYRSAFASVFGSGSVYVDGNAAGAIEYRTNTRLGLMRAYSTFSHPILGGVVLTSLLPLFYLSGIRSWPFWMGIAAAFLGFFSVSSIVVLMLAVGVGMLAFDRLKSFIPKMSWPILTGFVAFGLLLVHLATESGVQYVIIRYTFDPHNGFVRILQWEAAFKTLAETPWFGIGYARVPYLPAWMPGSIDAHLLALALRTGWLTAIAYYFAAVWMIVYVGLTIDSFPAKKRNIIVALNIKMALLLMASLTVAFFGETNVYYMAILGVGGAFCAIPRPRRVMMPTIPTESNWGQTAQGPAE